MCDYSLRGIPNRLAREGEDLVVYQFRTGARGLTEGTSGTNTDTGRSWRIGSAITESQWRRYESVCTGLR